MVKRIYMYVCVCAVLVFTRRTKRCELCTSSMTATAQRPPCYAHMRIIASNGKKMQKKIAAAIYTLFIIHLMLLFLFVFEHRKRARD